MGVLRCLGVLLAIAVFAGSAAPAPAQDGEAPPAAFDWTMEPRLGPTDEDGLLRYPDTREERDPDRFDVVLRLLPATCALNGAKLTWTVDGEEETPRRRG